MSILCGFDFSCFLSIWSCILQLSTHSVTFQAFGSQYIAELKWMHRVSTRCMFSSYPFLIIHFLLYHSYECKTVLLLAWWMNNQLKDCTHKNSILYISKSLVFILTISTLCLHKDFVLEELRQNVLQSGEQMKLLLGTFV